MNTFKQAALRSVSGILVCVVIASSALPAHAGKRASASTTALQPVPRNPFLADSPYPFGHNNPANAQNTPWAGFGDIGRPLRPDEVTWKPTGVYISNLRYSGLYPNGKRVIWTGGGPTLYKYDADTMELLAETEVLPDIGIRMTPGQVISHVAELDRLDGKELLQKALPPIATDLLPYVFSFYHNFISSKNEQYIGINDMKNKRMQIRVYGDAIEGNPASAIALRRELTLPGVEPGKNGIINILQLTYDGTVIVMLTDGTLFAVSMDLKVIDRISLPHKVSANGDGDRSFDSFVRNIISLDNDGGIYIVSRDYFQRVQWTGTRLSMDEKEGAWRVSYDNGPRGSGTSPNVMGWGDREDKLVLLSSGTGPYVMAYWRDRIPDDWKGLPGEERRLVARVKTGFGKYYQEGSIKEFTNVVKGYGLFSANDQTMRDYAHDVGFTSTSSKSYQTFDEFLTLAFGTGKKPEYSPLTGHKYEWNPRTRKLEHKWITMRAFATVVPIVDKNDVLYYIGNDKGVWTLEGLDWNTGKQKFIYELGTSQRYNPVGTALEVAPDGGIDCACGGGLGWWRARPQPAPAATAR